MRHEAFDFENRGRFCIEFPEADWTPIDTFETIAKAIASVVIEANITGLMTSRNSGYLNFEVKLVVWDFTDTEPSIAYWKPINPGRRFIFSFDSGVWVVIEHMESKSVQIAQGRINEKI